MLGKSPREVLLEILRNHKLEVFANDSHDDMSFPSCKCGHLLGDMSIEEHQTELITLAFLNFIKP